MRRRYGVLHASYLPLFYTINLFFDFDWPVRVAIQTSAMIGPASFNLLSPFGRVANFLGPIRRIVRACASARPPDLSATSAETSGAGRRPVGYGSLLAFPRRFSSSFFVIPAASFFAFASFGSDLKKTVSDHCPPPVSARGGGCCWAAAPEPPAAAAMGWLVWRAAKQGSHTRTGSV
jgi:hypothetical protein